MYLQPDEYAAFGLSESTDTAKVQAASALIDAHLKRSEGLLMTNGADGGPCYMTNKSPTLTLTSVDPITAGAGVAVTVTGYAAGLLVGTVLILDRANAASTEACAVTSVVGNVVTLDTVQFDHTANCKMEAGLVIDEARVMPQGRPLTLLSRTPAVRVLSGIGRYGYGRRGDQNNYQMNDFNLLAALSHFGGPPAWEYFAPTKAGIDPHTGQLWAPAGIMLAYYSEIRVWYVAGYTSDTLPTEIKQACAQIINTQGAFPEMDGSIKSLKAGDTQIQRFSDTTLSADVKALLEPYVARSYA